MICAFTYLALSSHDYDKIQIRPVVSCLIGNDAPLWDRSLTDVLYEKVILKDVVWARTPHQTPTAKVGFGRRVHLLYVHPAVRVEEDTGHFIPS